MATLGDGAKKEDKKLILESIQEKKMFKLTVKVRFSSHEQYFAHEFLTLLVICGLNLELYRIFYLSSSSNAWDMEFSH